MENLRWIFRAGAYDGGKHKKTVPNLLLFFEIYEI